MAAARRNWPTLIMGEKQLGVLSYSAHAKKLCSPTSEVGGYTGVAECRQPGQQRTSRARVFEDDDKKIAEEKRIRELILASCEAMAAYEGDYCDNVLDSDYWHDGEQCATDE